MQTDTPTVELYLAALPEDRRQALTAVRELIRVTAPDAVEGMRNGVPHYALEGPLFALASRQRYMSLYVAEPQVVAAYRPRLGALSVGRGCIRFARLERLPFPAVRELLRDAAGARRGGGVPGAAR